VKRTRLLRALIKLLKERYGDEIRHRWYRDPFKVLVSCVLSQRTREENTERASSALFAAASTPHELLRIPRPKLERLVKPAGFPRQKAARLRAIAKILVQRFNGKVPRSFQELVSLPGVGPKTANVVLCYGFGVPAIPVDTHVNRISRRLGFVPPDAKLEEVAPALARLFPRSEWYILNRGLVLFGREICRPIRPKCPSCPLRTLCPTGRSIPKKISEEE
jgi:endonuclease-3